MAVSSTTKEVCNEESSVPLNFTVTMLPAKVPDHGADRRDRHRRGYLAPNAAAVVLGARSANLRAVRRNSRWR
jgi:hypothetical protein